jgi:hypothetical protein
LDITTFILYIAPAVLLAVALGATLRRALTAQGVPVFLLLYLTLPIGQLVTLYSFRFDGWSLYWLCGLGLGLASMILLPLYVTYHEKTAALQEELRETRHTLELEKSHNDAVAIRGAEFSAIRDELNSRLEKAILLARSGSDAASRRMILSIADTLGQTKENTYCDIPVVNAVLTVKSREAAAAGALLLVDLQFPPGLAVKPIHLCSILGNLLDNAITACGRYLDPVALSPSSGTTPEPIAPSACDPDTIAPTIAPTIRLSSMADGDYLFIKATNPSPEPAKNPHPAGGWAPKSSPSWPSNTTAATRRTTQAGCSPPWCPWWLSNKRYPPPRKHVRFFRPAARDD